MDDVVQKPNKGLSTITAKLRDKVLTSFVRVIRNVPTKRSFLQIKNSVVCIVGDSVAVIQVA